MNDNNTKPGPTGPDWADACRAKADELEAIRKQIVHLTSTMSSVNYQMDVWERRLKELTGEGLPSTIRLLPKQKITFRPRQKLLERVKGIDKDTHGRRFRSIKQDEGESHSTSKLALNILDPLGNESGQIGTGTDSNVQNARNKPALPHTEKMAINRVIPICDPENCMKKSRMSNLPLPKIKGNDISITTNLPDSKSEEHQFVEDKKETEISLQDMEPDIQSEDCSKSTTVSTKTSSVAKSSGLNKEFKKLFKMLDTEIDRRKKERKNKEEDVEREKAKKLHRAYSHIPSRCSGLYNEFEELFRLLDNQQMQNSRRVEQISILSELDDVVSSAHLDSPFICQECYRGSNMYADNRERDYFWTNKNDENHSQSANTDVESENIEEKFMKSCKNVNEASNICKSNSAMCSICNKATCESQMTAILSYTTKAEESKDNISSNAVQKVHWAEELQKTYSVSRTENRDQKRRKKKAFQESTVFPERFDCHSGQKRSNPNTFPHSGDDRNQRNLQLHIKDVLIELPPIPNDVIRKRGNIAEIQNELCGWMGQLSGEYLQPQEPMPSPKDAYDHLYMEQRDYRKPTYCLPAVQRFTGKKLRKNQILRKPKVEEVTHDGNISSEDIEDTFQTYGDSIDVHDKEESKHYQYESDEKDIDDVCAKLNFVELENPPCQKIKRKEFAALPPIKGIGIRTEKKQMSGTKQHNLELKIDQRVSADEKRSVSPVRKILKPLPPMKARTTSQMVNWTQKNVGPIKVPPLDLSSVESSEKVQGVNFPVNYITDMVQKSPKIDASLRNSDMANTMDEFYFNAQEDKLPSDNLLRYHFQRKADDKTREKYIFSSTLLGKKIQFASDSERPVKEEFDAFAHKKYRLRDESKDVPMELVKIAMKANRCKGYNNVNQVLQESKRCASLFNSKGESHNCKRFASTTSRKAKIGKPNLQKFVQNNYRDACVQEEAELQALRSRLRDCVREEASKKTNRWYQRQEENENMSESARSAIARPCSPASNRTPA